MTDPKPGYTRAVQPLADTAMTTDDGDLETGATRIPVADGTIPAFHARPKSLGPHPVVIVVHEIFGLHEYIRDVCRRLARAGYFCVAPDLYQRQGDVGKIADIWGIITNVVEKVPDEQVLDDLDATVAWATANPHADTGRLGITGFCWGGRIVWAYSAHHPGLRAGVAWYGRLVGGGPLVPGGIALPRTYPIDIAGRLHGPVLALFGDKDKSIPLPSIEQMRSALAAAGDPSELVVYPGADHGFHADYRPQYHATAAADGWQRMLDWFRQHGVA
jgi:carboxymethylenebutenolidase